MSGVTNATPGDPTVPTASPGVARTPAWIAPPAQWIVARPKVRWALSSVGIRHLITATFPVYRNGKLVLAATWECQSSAATCTLVPDNWDQSPTCHRCGLVDKYGTEPSVYRYFDADDFLLYIGSTVNFGMRHYQHSMSAEWWNEAARWTVDPYPSEFQARAAERQAIATEHPIHNRAGRRGAA